MFSIHITWVTVLAAGIAYCLGSLSTAVVISKLAKLPDPREEGSKNPGATNMLRLVGKQFATMTLLGDMLKGIAAVLIGRLLMQSGFNLSLIALSVFLGHVYPIFFGFKGGKGVATFLGSLVALSPMTGLVAIVTWLIIALVFRYSSLAALITAALSPLYAIMFHHMHYILCLIMIAVLLFWRHRANIERLKNHTEQKIHLHSPPSSFPHL